MYVYVLVTAVIVVLLLLFVLIVVAILVYFFWYKPKRDIEIAEKAYIGNANGGIYKYADVLSCTKALSVHRVKDTFSCGPINMKLAPHEIRSFSIPKLTDRTDVRCRSRILWDLDIINKITAGNICVQ